MSPDQENGSLPLLLLSHLTKKFGALTAVWDVNIEIHRGDFLAIFGPNGAGKTTLLRMIAALISPTRGQISFADGAVSRSRVGYVSHQSLVYNEMTGRENLQFYATLYGLPEPWGQADRMLERMGLTHAAGRLVREYSRGMKQRLTLGRALIHDPHLLLLDEPYTGLDQQGSRLLTENLRGLRDEGRTVLMITHSLFEGLNLSTRVAIQNRGEIVYEARRGEIDGAEFERVYFEMTN
ncbi:MAG: ABC transporter ATP-binding protein [Acidobacteriota bacterium]